MKKNINFYIFTYLTILFFFSVFFLYQKHQVANDSTISEWLINYEGGFTKRGLIGQLSIYLSNFFIIKLREGIFILQKHIIFKPVKSVDHGALYTHPHLINKFILDFLN